MAKEVAGIIKLQIRGGTANPSPPVGPALGAKGVNIMEFCKAFNAQTQKIVVFLVIGLIAGWLASFIVMGGGLGVMAGCSHRVVTEATRIAMPEVTIASLPMQFR